MHKVCLTNDDGPASVGLKKLAAALGENHDLLVVVPDSQRSGSGKALTLSRPIRILDRSDTGKYKVIVHDGLPADSVAIALSEREDFDLFVSGINPGANLGYHRMLTSGTIGAAMEAALQGYPAIAISQDVESKYWFTREGTEINLDSICMHAKKVIELVQRKGFPEGIDVLNLNFPDEVTNDTPIIVTEPTIAPVRNRIEEREDPYGGAYYWLQGGEKGLGSTDDVVAVTEKNNITVSPIVIRSPKTKELETLRYFLEI
ncbi:5'/3'-nucleotidase SurE [Candidatus Thorarchaeota archaeon]|nr:MAG: 5'/3'-nucleotidase SurE [Candidatus Thorarchaeota archaeon]